MNAESRVTAEHAGMRLDRYIAEVMEIASRSRLKHYELSARVAGTPAKMSRKLEEGDTVSVEYTEPPGTEIEPEDIPLDIIYEDEDVIVVDKPRGMVVHPGAGNRSGTLVQGILHHCSRQAAEFSDEPLRPGIVHRLDKETSGVIIVAKNKRAHEYLSSQFRRRKTKKRYIAIVKGEIRHTGGTIDHPVARDRNHRKRFTWTRPDGKQALTRYKVVKRFPGYTLVLLAPKTGRTHQLRVHMFSENYPILGDPVYGRKDHRFPDAGLMLHASALTIRLPEDREEHTFKAPMPKRFHDILIELDR
ncbi:MAG: RluA family pseudouridine synthase [Spirochaetia bacterium]